MRSPKADSGTTVALDTGRSSSRSTRSGASGSASLTAAVTRASWPAGAATTTGPRPPLRESRRKVASVTLPAIARSPRRVSRARRLARDTRYSGRSPGKAAAVTTCSRRSSGQISTGRMSASLGAFEPQPPYCRPTRGSGQAKIRSAAGAPVGGAAGLDARLESPREQADLPRDLFLRLAERLPEPIERLLDALARLRDLLRRFLARARAEQRPAEPVHRLLEPGLGAGHLRGHRLLDPGEALPGEAAPGGGAPHAREVRLDLGQ